ncbi:ATP-binding protein [Planctomycetota bacterium]
MNEQSFTILVVEDDMIDHQQVERLLVQSNLSIHEVLHAEFLKEALACLGSSPIDVALVDLNLPDSSGLATVRKIHQQFPNVPLVVVTSEDAQELGLQALACGAQDYMIKGDFDSHNLMRTIRYACERSRVEKTIKTQAIFLRTLLDAIPCPVFYKDREGCYLGCNVAFETITSLTHDQIVGKTAQELWPERYEGIHHDTDLKLMQNMVCQQFEYSLTDSQETKRDFIVYKSTFPDTAGRGAGIIGAMLDITDRKAAEAAMHQINQTLEKANHDLKDMHAQVVQSEKLASIGQLAAGVAHELNTPVGFVASNFETLQKYAERLKTHVERYEALAEQLKDSQDTALQTRLEEIHQATRTEKIPFILDDIEHIFDESRDGLDRVTSIVRNLRDFSRVDHAEHREEFCLNNGIEATLVVARNAIKYDADVVLELGEIPPVICNAGQVNQVFLNIMVNAAQAIKGQSRDSRGTITVRTYTESDYLVCDIQDDGPGIPPETLAQIFDPFFTTKPVGKGTGLGLSVSYDIIVNKHKGLIEVDSEVGKGTRFRVCLPLQMSEVVGVASEATPSCEEDA